MTADRVASRAAGIRAARPALLALGGSLLLAGTACSGGSRPAGARPESVPVTVASAETRDVPLEIRAVGNVVAHSTVEVRAQVGGSLLRVGFREGDRVRRGQLLFALDSRPYEAAVAEAEAALARDRAKLENAREQVRRYKGLVAKEYVTAEQYDALVAAESALAAEVRADEAAVESARVQLSYCTIRSPLDGRTGRLVVHVGNLVKANDSTPLVVVHEVEPIDVAFSVPQAALPEIRRRSAEEILSVEAAPQGGDSPSSGELSFVDNAVDTATGTILLKATFPNRARTLWPGQFVSVRLRLGVRAGAVVIPSQAVQTGQQGSYVFVVKGDGTVDLRVVETGPSLDGAVVIEKGVAAGETVVTDGQLRLVPGARVEAKPPAAAGTSR